MKNKKFKKALKKKTKRHTIPRWLYFHRINHSNMPITQATLANATLNCPADAVSCYDLRFLKGLRNLSTVSRTLVKLIPLFLPNLLAKASVGPLSRNNFSGYFVAIENSWHCAISSRHDVWETSVEIPYWRRVTTQIWVVYLIGRATSEIFSNQSEALPRSRK